MSSQKRIITPEHFRVSPDVLGLPLASPSRRAWAMAIDLVLVTILVKAGGPVFLGIVAAFVLFKASASKQRTGFVRTSVRFTLRILGAIVLFVVIGNFASSLTNRAKRLVTDTDDDEPPATVDSSLGELNLDIPPREIASLGGALLTLRTSDDSTKISEATSRILTVAKTAGATTKELHEARDDMVGMLGDSPGPAEVRAVDAAVLQVAGPLPDVPSQEETFRSYLAAVERNDTLATRRLQDSIRTAVAGADLENQQKAIDALKKRNDRLEDDLEEARKSRGIRTFIAGAADDLGVGFGWSAVYFTAFLALWRGQTPGKRSAGLRVLRLDGKPMGWWMSFERFGGYAASFSVGLMGFVQILWDRNRQGLHDKACETVVVVDSAQARSRS